MTYEFIFKVHVRYILPEIKHHAKYGVCLNQTFVEFGEMNAII